MKSILPKQIEKNMIDEFGSSWALLSAKKPSDNSYNGMTVAWGGVGVMFGEDVCYIVVRPQRFTKEFIDESKYFSLSFFNPSYKKMLGYLGKVSGRDEDKMTKSELTLIENEFAPVFKEANMTIVCEKMFCQEFKEDCFLQKEIVEKWYPDKDFHTFYIGKIKDVLVNE